MKMDQINSENLSKLEDKIVQREKQERIASAALTSETLSRLNVTIDNLPHKHQQLLRSLAKRSTDLDPIAISLQQTRQISEQMTREYEVLELRQKNKELQKQIDRNRMVIEGLRRDLEESKLSLGCQSPNPDDVQEHVRMMKQKFASYEEIYEKAKAKFTKLNVPDAILPNSLYEMATRLATLKEEEASLKQRADDVTLARQARGTLSMLRR